MATNNENSELLKEALHNLLIEKGVSFEELTALTKIPRRYLRSIFEGDIKNMPAAPYVHGYIDRIAKILESDPEPLHSAYRGLGLRTSGRNDHLPKNKYAIKKGQYGIMAFIFILLAISVFVYMDIDRIVGIPSLEINIPEIKDSTERFTVSSSDFSIDGRVTDKDSVSINHEDIPVNADGSFSKKVILESGLNAFSIDVKRFLGKEKTFVREIYYEAPITASSTDSTIPPQNNGDFSASTSSSSTISATSSPEIPSGTTTPAQ